MTRFANQLIRVSLNCLIAGLSLLFVSGCKAETYTWRQAITVVVDTPGGPHESTTIQQIDAKYYGGRGLFATTTEVSYDTDAGPIIVELDQGKVLFGVLNTPEVAEQVYLDLGSRKAQFDAFTSPTPPEPRQIDFTLQRRSPLMLFLTFRDLADPTSIVQVDPTNLSQVFGEGYALTSATLAMVDAQLTPSRIEDLLPWITDHEDWLFLDEELPMPVVLGPSEFIAGVKR